MTIESFIEACKTDGQKIERLIRLFYSQMPGRDAFIDGGAHHGYHTGFAREAFSGKVISVEASPKTYIQHITNQIAYRAPGPLCDVVPVNAALGHRAGQGDTIEFFFSEAHPGRSTVNTKLWEKWGKGEVVYEAPTRAPVIEIDDLKALHAARNRVDFIKLDLEGNEINALRGAVSVLRLDRPAVVMEYGLSLESEALYNETRAGFLDMMHAQDYVLRAPWGAAAEDMIRDRYPFWYVFAFPKAQAATLSALLKRCFGQIDSEQGASP